jgi:hypothetical protein
MNHLTNVPKKETSRIAKLEALEKQGIVQIKTAYNLNGEYLPDYISVFCENNARAFVLKEMDCEFAKKY